MLSKADTSKTEITKTESGDIKSPLIRFNCDVHRVC